MAEERHGSYKYGILCGGDYNIIKYYVSHQEVLKTNSFVTPIIYDDCNYQVHSTNIVDFNKISGLSLKELEVYKKIIYKNTLVFIIYDEIYEIDNFAWVRFSLTIGEEDFKFNSEELIDEVIANKLAIISSDDLSKSNQQRIKEFISQYSNKKNAPEDIKLSKSKK